MAARRTDCILSLFATSMWFVFTCTFAWDESVMLTPANPTSSLASVALVPNQYGNIIYQNKEWQCTQDGNSLCTYLKVNDECNTKSIIRIGIYGGRIKGDVDLINVFSYTDKTSGNDKFFSILNDWDGLVSAGKGKNGGVFIAPHCAATNNPSFYYTINNIFNLIKDRDEKSDTKKRAIRDAAAGGDSVYFELLTSTKVRKTSPIWITLEIDRTNDNVKVSFESEKINPSVSCILSGAIPKGEIIANFFADHLKSIVGFDKFQVDYQCGNPPAPTKKPTPKPAPQPTPKPTKKPTNQEITECEYTHTCKAMGDPHITTWDNTLYHFQGSGYFNYLIGCTNDDRTHLPVIISALQEESPNHAKAAIIKEVIVSLSDGNNPYALEIIFPNDGQNPKFRSGANAVGKHLFFNRKYEAIISNSNFEILFNLNDGSNQRGKIKFTYQGTSLKIRISDCLSKYLCGLCGKLNDNPNDDFQKCDTKEIISNYGVSAIWDLPTNAERIAARDNVNEFGESCCNKHLDNEYLDTSDCSFKNPVIDDCIDLDITYNLCKKSYNNLCSNCKASSPSEEWLINCGYDICLNKECKEKIETELNGGNEFTLLKAKNMGCLDTVKSECQVNCPNNEQVSNTLCDKIYDAVSNSNIKAVPFYRWWKKNVGNHFYTKNGGYDGYKYGYDKEGIEGYIWNGAINGGYTVPFYRFRSNDIMDDYYTDNGNGIDSTDKMDHSHTISNYEYKQISGYIMRTHCPSFNQPLYRYWSKSYKDHFYTIEYRDTYGDDYVFEDVAGYVAREAM